MNLLLKSEQIKPVKFRIVSNNVLCADLQMLKNNFSITDLQKVNDFRLNHWLVSIGQPELAKQVKDLYPSYYSICADPLGFIKLFFQEELSQYHSTPEILHFFKSHRYAVLTDLLQSNASTLLEYYHSAFQQDFTSEEWLIFFNRFPSETACIPIRLEIKSKLIPDNIRGFDVVEELLDKVMQQEELPIPLDFYIFLEEINVLIASVINKKKPRNHVRNVNHTYKSLCAFLHKRTSCTKITNSACFITSALFYIYQKIDFFEAFKCKQDYYRSNEIKYLLINARECTYMEEFDKETLKFIQEADRLIDSFYFYKKSEYKIRRDIPQKYKVAYEFIVKYLMEFSSKDSFEYFVCQYLSTLLVKIK